jgi:poly(A) polymerase
MSQGVEMPTARATHRFYRELGDTAASVLYLSLADYLAARGPRLEEAEWRHRVAQVNHMLESVKREEAPERKERFVTGIWNQGQCIELSSKAWRRPGLRERWEIGRRRWSG